MAGCGSSPSLHGHPGQSRGHRKLQALAQRQAAVAAPHTTAAQASIEGAAGLKAIALELKLELERIQAHLTRRQVLRVDWARARGAHVTRRERGCERARVVLG